MYSAQISGLPRIYRWIEPLFDPLSWVSQTFIDPMLAQANTR
jgi:hypothetical protein